MTAVLFCTGAGDCVYPFFFFQAEDGIRDHCVTGVQTCALPILDKAADGHKIKWQWLKGHAGHVAQEAVDKAARKIAAAGHADEAALSDAAAIVAEEMKD